VTSGNESLKKSSNSSTSKSPLNKSTLNKSVESKLLKDNTKKRKSVESTERVKLETDDNGGEWIEAVSRKRRSKNKDQAKQEAEAKTNEKSKVGETSPNVATTPKATKAKKGKENKEPSGNKSNEKSTPKAPTKSTPKTDKKNVDKKSNSEKAKSQPVKNEPELIAEDPDQYAFAAKESRSSKKAKSLNQKYRKTSESAKPEAVVLPASLTTGSQNKKPQNDQITAAIIANYEKDENNAESKKAKKKPNKKKASSGEEKSSNKNEKRSKTGQPNNDANKSQLPAKLPQPVLKPDGTKTQSNIAFAHSAKFFLSSSFTFFNH